MAGARADARSGAVHLIDLDAPARGGGAPSEPTGLDRLLDDAIGRAVADALSGDRPYGR